VYLTLCAVSNHITKFTREEWIAHRDFAPIVPVEDDALVAMYALIAAGNRKIIFASAVHHGGNLRPADAVVRRNYLLSTP
jgi:hypothetical protein